jgi:asparagine synthase (glutamine-hydrolysing)
LVKLAPNVLRKVGAAALLQLSPAQWNDIGRLPPLRKRVALLGDKVHKMAVRLRSIETADDVYRSMVTVWRATEDPALAASVLPMRLDDLSVIAGVEGMEPRMMLLDGLTYLPDDILAKVDRAAMATSLETRVPLLDHRLAEFAWRLPMSLKIKGGATKWALRQILYERVPKMLIDRPKSGFGIPVGQWLRGPLRDWAEALLDERRLGEEGYLDVAQTRRLWREHQDGARDWTSRLWNILMFQAWLESGRIHEGRKLR